MPEGPMSFEAALAEAEAEMGLAEPVESHEDLPSSVEDAPPSTEKAPEDVEGQPEAENEVEGLLDLLAEEQPAGEAPKPSDPAFWDTEVEVEFDGESKRVTLDELRKGSMMRADYTRKTQEIARERALIGEAAEFHKAFLEDPTGFAQYIAQKAGIVEEGEAKDLKGVRLYTEADIETQVAERLEKAIADHPDIQAVRLEQELMAVDQAFSRLEQRVGAKLTNQHRITVLQEAKNRGTADLELVFDSLMLRASQAAKAREQAKKTTSTRPGAVAPTQVQPAPDKKLSMEEALLQALEEAGTVA